ncbi:hypothetical protein FRC02_006622 [Tulasnella sp. 418]|nr:hypothetical protein FRC02_006622 [Tulasnella sp. 418]
MSSGSLYSNIHSIAQVSMSKDQEQASSSHNNGSSSQQTQPSSIHPEVEQVWASFVPSSSPSPVIWPVRADHRSSTRNVSNLPTTVLGLNNQKHETESDSDESDGDGDSDDELIELIGLYQTRYHAAQKQKVSRSEQKKKIAIIRRNSFLQGDAKYRTNLHVNGTSRLRQAADLPNETLNFAPSMVLQKAKKQIRDVFNSCSKFFATHDGRNCKKPKYQSQSPFPKVHRTPRVPLGRMTFAGTRANRGFGVETGMSPAQIYLPIISSAPLHHVEEYRQPSYVEALLPLPDSKTWYYHH